MEQAATLDATVYASVSLVLRRRQVQTPVDTDDRPRWADQLHYELGRGPRRTWSGRRRPSPSRI
ncbi:hypothetical protein ACI780_17925 [Geodermatophilus sp. SYSU D00814]